MTNKIFILLMMIVFFIVACSMDGNPELMYHYDTSLSYDESILTLDSVSNCINSQKETEIHSKTDSLFIERQDDKDIIVFPFQIYCSKENIKSVGVYAFGDTLKLELIEKEKTPGSPLDCPVWAYSSVKENLDGKYVKIRNKIYPLIKR